MIREAHITEANSGAISAGEEGPAMSSVSMNMDAETPPISRYAIAYMPRIKSRGRTDVAAGKTTAGRDLGCAGTLAH
jgi:hypothetical protein